MATQVKTLNFLPEVFRTETNAQFFAATLDQLVAEPDLRRVEGYIGAKYGYSVNPKDVYVFEPTQERTDYQLDPSVIFLKPDTQTAKDFISYPGMVNALKNQGAITDNNSRLFENEFYSWDSFVDLDMIVNYSQYYWMPNGPDAVVVSTEQVYSNTAYTVTGAVGGFTLDGYTQKNPTITLLRGGTYTFAVDETAPFWIQGAPGITGYAGTNVSTRDVLGVTNNGIDTGTVTFTVPAKDAQQQYNLPGNNTVDLVSDQPYANINGQSITTVTNIDGVTQLDGKTLMFYNNGELSTQVTYYTIAVTGGTITLTAGSGIPNSEKITVANGTTYVGRSLYRDGGTGEIVLIPYLSAILDTLYYQSGTDPLSVGTINLIESNATNSIDVATEILGQANYISPNGVTFINGLKVLFQGNVIPATYQNNEYYVAGVGTAIQLLAVNDFLSVESQGEGTYIPWDSTPWDSGVWDQTIYVPLEPDYIVIDRNSRDRNAWSRGNRWFNIGVINATTQYNGQVTSIPTNQPQRAKRPIIQFEANLGLYNYGTKFLNFVTLFDTTTTDAFTQVVGQTEYTVDGVTLVEGQTVIFNADINQEVRQTIYTVNFVPAGTGSELVIALTPTPQLRWWEGSDPSLVDAGVQTVATNRDQIYVLSGNSYAGTAWRFSRTITDSSTTGSWIFAQQKTQINQPPLFDIYDANDFSLSDPLAYPGSTFRGTKLFSYTPGTGANDSVLGFPISYSSATSIGDIEFTVNLNSDTFNYQTTGTTVVTANVNIGYVYDYVVADIGTKRTGWVKAYQPSSQGQVFLNTVTYTTQSVFICDVVVIDSIYDPHEVWINGVELDDADYSVTTDTTNNTTTITLTTPAVQGDQVTIILYSNQVSQTAYYQIPTNLQNNPFNTNVTSVNVGDLKNQYVSIFGNALGTTGQVFGPNNVYNLGNLNQYGTAIIQSSATMVLPGAFLRDPNLNLMNALQFNSEQYYNYKTLLVSLTDQNDFSIYTTPAVMLDTILYQISTTKVDTDPFFWSDMLPSGHPYVTNTTPQFTIPVTTVTLPLSRTYNFTSANFWGLCVYVNTTVNDQAQTIQLIRGVDYTVSTFAPEVTINYNIAVGDTVTINEYNQTYGSYCPNTPTKIGAYKSFVPAVILDSTYTTPTYFILGHDGSYNKLYGEYTNGRLTDFRDQVLLEFESRVYNNLKVSGAIPLPADEVIPGQFRTTDYTYEEIIEIYTTNFLKWVGTNRIDYKTQIYNRANQYTYNYNQSTDKIGGELLQQGYWRGIYQWFYDTSNPAAAPWEMLGLTSEPTWWTGRYGSAPYTSDNLVMWQDIAAGYIWNNGEPYVDPLKVRPGLLDVLPVNSAGTLLPPLPTVVKNYNQLTFQRDWRVGDQAPAETSYLRSSTWPFDLMKLLALTKPAKFYNLLADRDLYKYNTEFGQYLYNDRYHLDPTTLEIYGYNETTKQGVSKASYINWVVDYIAQRGVNGTTVVSTTLQNLDVRLTYNLAGFSSKQYLNFLIEKSTPDTQNSTLLIPDNSYSVLLYNNVPEDKIVYSSVIVQKTNQGWTVWGNSQSDPYFVLAVPAGGTTETLTTNGLSVEVSAAYFTNQTTQIAYGTEFYSAQGVAEFIKSYGQHLSDQGMIFNYTENTVTYTWNQLILQFLWWIQQDWAVGSTISLNPAARVVDINRPGLVVQPLTLQQQNFVLNQNLIPLQNQNIAVIRDNTAFTTRVLSDADSVAYGNFNLASIEHAVIFDNYTVFNDTIYDLITGLRQERLLLRGYKSGAWNGCMNASGFLLNEDNIQEWSPNRKYPVGSIVTYKSSYWVANQLIEPQTNVQQGRTNSNQVTQFDSNFVQEQWTPISYDSIQTGLLPNPSTAAYESLYYYNTTVPNFAGDADLSAYSLIGYRPRQYMADAELTLTTQINVYQQLIQLKGTNLIANAFKKAQLLQGQIDYDIKENWAIKSSVFGSTLNSNFVECLLDQSILTGNPTIVAYTNGTPVTGAQENVDITTELINYEIPPLTPNFLPAYTSSYSDERGLPTAGYVNLDDAKFKVFTLTDLNANVDNLNRVYRGDTIWVASYRGSWDVFTPQALQVQVTGVINNLNGTITIEFASAHGLEKYDPVVLCNLDTRVNGSYEIQSVTSNTRVVVARVLDPSVLQIVATGVLFKLVSRRFEQASDQTYSTVQYSEFYAKNSWIDSDQNDQWAVYQSAPVYKQADLPISGGTNNNIGSSVAYSAAIGYVTADSSAGIIYRVYTDSNGVQQVQTIEVPGSNVGAELVAIGDTLYASDSVNGEVYIFTLVPSINLLQETGSVLQANTGAIAVTSDLSWLFIANSSSRTVAAYLLQDDQYVYINTITGPTDAEGFGTSLAVSNDGEKIIIGAPLESLDAIDNCGSVYVYSRTIERFFATGQTTFTVSQTIPQQRAIVSVNDVAVSNVIVFANGNVSFTTAPAYGSTVEVSYGQFILVQQFYSNTPINGGDYGISVATNKWGAQFVVGAPFDLVTANNIINVAGAAYVYVNSGQQYGSIVGEVSGSQSGTVFIDGYIVNFNGTISQIVTQINVATPENIVASSVDNQLIIGIASAGGATTVNDLIDLVGTQANLAKLGITLYTNTQVVTNPNLTTVGQFGSSVALDNNSNTLIVSDPTASALSETTFDYSAEGESPQNLDNYTIFDNGAATFVDSFPLCGVVYEYNLLPASNETILNPAQYVFGQYIQTIDRAGIATEPLFGTSIAINDGVIIVGAPDWYGNGNGRVIGYYPVGQDTAWWVDKQPLPMVAINNIRNVSIYNTESNQTLSYLDYIDPVQGKLLGAVTTNLDFIRSTDPAVYGTGLVWGAERVGATWLDTTNLRMLNYNQPDITYNASRWGQAFPGSVADIYTWIVSPVPPIQYSGTGIIVNFNNYNQAQRLDKSTNAVVTDYYFWVKNAGVIPPGKTLSPQTVSQYILNPLGSGIAYLAPLTTNAVALMNSGSSINANTSALHLGYAIGTSADQKHTSWTLIQEKTPDEFLSGLPTTLNDYPTGMYLQYINSFAGQTPDGTFVPNKRLPPLQRYGTEPNQSMFVKRDIALQNYVEYANAILIQFPIAEYKSLYFLEQSGPGYDTANYWQYTTWWATGYSSATKVIFEVEYYNDLQTIMPNQIITGTDTIIVGLQNGLIAKVNKNNQGNAEYYVYDSTTGWVRIGLENGTIQILSNIYTDSVGWDSSTYDSGVWDSTLSQPIYWIVRWLNEQCYIDDLLAERNNSLILMFNYMASEALQQQNYMPWLNKTSLINVSHKVRELLPYKTYQRDNQEFLEGYLNEVKPFHVKINDFLFTYPGSDTYLGDVTDFDLPAQYDVNTDQFLSPQLVYSDPNNQPNQYLPTDTVWQEPQYSQWFQHYGLSITNEANKFAELEQQLFELTKLSAAIAPSDSIIPVQNTFAMPSTGTIYIGAEKIDYGSVDHVNNTLTNVTRGVDSAAASHPADSAVYSVLPPVMVVYGGRGYTEPPQVTLVYDTAIYPLPRIPATLTATLGAEAVLSIAVVNAGSGYPVLPQIRITGSSILGAFASTAINTTDNTIEIVAHPFVTGDIVTYTLTDDTTVPPAGLTPYAYYYIRSVDADTIALYYTIDAAVDVDVDPLLDNNRVHLIDDGSGSGNQFAVTAKAVILTSGQPVREMITTIKFDRTSYGSTVTEWSPTGVYAGLLADPDTDATFPVTAVIDNQFGQGPTFLELSYEETDVAPGQLNGQQVTFYNVVGSNNVNPVVYYIRAVNGVQVQIYYDPLFNNPVPFSVYDAWATGDDVAVLSAPIVFNQSLVTYAGKLYQCVVSNNNVANFNYDQWVRIYSDNPILNAADRIMAFYQPTANMSGRDLRQLMLGVTYPNATVLGTPFGYGSGLYDNGAYDSNLYDQNVQFEPDAVVISPPFNWDPNTNPTQYDLQGGRFADGYGPEELIPGVVVDELEMWVTTNPESLPEGESLNFRISVGMNGVGSVYNTNPYTQTVLTEDFVSTGGIGDILYVEDAAALIADTVVTATTDSSGVVTIGGNMLEIVLPITIDGYDSADFTYEAVPGPRIQITISGISSPTEVTIHLPIGNMLLVAAEYIQFTEIDLSTNSVTGLLRGRRDTITNAFIEAGTTVQSVLERDRLATEYYSQWWYNTVSVGWDEDGTLGWDSGGWDAQVFADQTLAESTTVPAVFLQNNTA